MAIIKGVEGIEVTLSVDGKDLNEYVDENNRDEEKTVSRYVEAVSGKDFAVRCRISREAKFEGDSISFKVHADGKKMRGIYMHHRRLKGKAAIERLVEDVRVASNLYQKLVFSEIHTSEHVLPYRLGFS